MKLSSALHLCIALCCTVQADIIWKQCDDDVYDKIGLSRESRRLREFQQNEHNPFFDFNVDPYSQLETIWIPKHPNMSPEQINEIRRVMISVTVECGTLSVPEDPETPSSKSIENAVYRISLPSAVEKRNYWILQGGPGGSGLSILFLAAATISAGLGTHIYLPDHRGTGRSANLRCDEFYFDVDLGIQPNEVEGCFRELENDPEHFTVTNAAKDLSMLITESQKGETPAPTVVHGISYGSMWAQRFLQLFPDQVEKVILEGVVSMDGFTFNKFHKYSQYAGDVLMKKCDASSDCPIGKEGNPKMLEMIKNIVDKNNECMNTVMRLYEEGTDRLAVIQTLMYQGLVQGSIEVNESTVLDMRVAMVALIYRLNRCDDSKGDAKVALHFVSMLKYTPPSSSRKNAKELEDLKEDIMEELNLIVYHNIRYSELWDHENMLTPGEFKAANSNVYFGITSNYESDYNLAKTWEQYPNEVLEGKYPENISSDVLVMNGELDGQTPLFSARQTFNSIKMAPGARKSLVIVPNGGHSSYTVGCGLEAVTAFLDAAKGAQISVSCSNGISDPAGPTSEDVLPSTVADIEFKVDPSFAQSLSTTKNLWEGSYEADFCEDFTGGNTKSCSSAQSLCYACFEACLLDNGNSCDCVTGFGTCVENNGCDDDVCPAFAKSIGCEGKCNSSGNTILYIIMGISAAALLLGLATLAYAKLHGEDEEVNEITVFNVKE